MKVISFKKVVLCVKREPPVNRLALQSKSVCDQCVTWSVQPDMSPTWTASLQTCIYNLCDTKHQEVNLSSAQSLLQGTQSSHLLRSCSRRTWETLSCTYVHCRHNRRTHGVSAAISTMPGTQRWVSVVLGWTPHPDICCPGHRHRQGRVDCGHYCCDWIQWGQECH